jgi:hypothetical protein
MPQRFSHRILLAVIVLGTAASGSAWAQRYSSDPRDMGLPASVRRIQHETGGQVLKAQPFERDGREVYRVKVLTPQGRIRVYEDDPRDEPPPVFNPRAIPAPAYPRQAPAPAYPRQNPRQFSPPPHNHRPA